MGPLNVYETSLTTLLQVFDNIATSIVLARKTFFNNLD